MLAGAAAEELRPILHTPFLWLELRWAAEHEAVMRLQDLMLRRSRLGLVLADGGLGLMDDIRALCQPILGWDDGRWEKEVNDYRRQWQANYAPPTAGERSHA
jgi:glycerol-3-phosphate dehydrogenase